MTDYDELAARAERGELTPIPGTARRGSTAQDASRADLMAATGADTLDQAVAIAIGRPPLASEDS
jgi:hypothetical protein